MTPNEVTDHVNKLKTTKTLRQKFTVAQIAAAKRYHLSW